MHLASNLLAHSCSSYESNVGQWHLTAQINQPSHHTECPALIQVITYSQNLVLFKI